MEKESSSSDSKITRRQFLKGLVATGAAIAAGGLSVEEHSKHQKQERVENTLWQNNREEDLYEKIALGEGPLSPEEKEVFSSLLGQAIEIDQTYKNLETKGPYSWDMVIKDYDERHGHPKDNFVLLIKELVDGQYDDPGAIRQLFKRPEFKYEGDVRVDGFERIGVDNNEVKRLAESLLPKGFLSCTQRIVFGGVQGEENRASSGQAQIDASTGERVLAIFEGINVDWSKGIDQPFFRGLICHEASHSADWNRNTVLSPAENINFFFLLLRRLKSPDRYRSQYVEMKYSLDRDPKSWMHDPTLLRNGSMEYWADVCEFYFSGYQTDYFGWGSQELAEGDRELVEWFISRVDPEWVKEKAWRYPIARKQPKDYS